jgi:uncharacterized protein YraI
MKGNRTYAKSLFVGLIVTLLAPFLLAVVAFAQATVTGTVNRDANLRAGPGTNYAIVGKATAGQTVTISGQNKSGNWYEVDGRWWIAAWLVNTGDNPMAATATATAPSAQPVNQATPLAPPTSVTAQRAANLRAGPGANYAIIGKVRAGQPLEITGKNADGSWLQLANNAWIAEFLVKQPALAQPTTAFFKVSPTPTPATSGNEFILVEKRLWDPYENGGSLDGPSVHCGQGRQLLVNVLDANGNRLNGVAVQVQYGARETELTGAQGKGDGVAEFVLGGGQDVKVIRDVDARTVTSDVATGLSTNPANIPHDILMSARYCQDEASCKHFAETNSCAGHFSWTVTFKRQW